MNRLCFVWREDAGLSCYLGRMQVGKVKKSNYLGFVATSFFPRVSIQSFRTSDDAKFQIEKATREFVREAGLEQKEVIA